MEAIKKAGTFDISHMGRFIISGNEAAEFLQHVLTENALDLDILQGQYTKIQNEHGWDLDEAYLYRFYEDAYLLVVNSSNAENDWQYLNKEIRNYYAVIKIVK
jgi:aminomethyltransferase